MSFLFIPFWLQHLPIVIGLTACLAADGKSNGVDTDTPLVVQSGPNATENQFDARSAAWPELPLCIENEDYTYTTH